MIKLYSYIIITLIFFSRIDLSLCQNYSILFDIQSGLPGNSVYDCAESNTGKLWIATDQGLVCYDGYSFKKVDLNDGLTTMLSWGFIKDSKGRLWLRNRQSPFTYIYNDSIHRIGASKIPKINFDWISEDSKGNIYISSLKSRTTHQIDANGKVKMHDSLLVLINKKNEQIWDKEILNGNHYKKRVIVGEYVLSIIDFETPPILHIEIWNTNTGKKEIHPLPAIKNFHHISKLDKENVLLSGSTGIYQFNIFTKQLTPYGNLHATKYKDVVVIYRDKFGNKWLCDFTKGIWFEKAIAPNISYHPMNFNDEIVYSSKATNNELFINSSSNYSLVINQNGSITSQNNYVQDKSLIKAREKYLHTKYKNYDLETYQNKVYLIKDNKSKVIDLPLNKWVSQTNFKFLDDAFKSDFYSDSLIAFGTAAGLTYYLFRNDKIKVNRLLLDYVFDIVGKKGHLYTVGMKGLNRINIQTNQVETILIDPTLVNICISTKYIIVRKEDGTIILLDIHTKKITQTITSFRDLSKIQMVDNEIWGIGSNRILKFDDAFSVTDEVNEHHGITNPNKLGIHKLNGLYYLICKDGYYTIDLQNSQMNSNAFDINFKLKSVLVNGIKTNTKNIRLNSENNSVQIQLQCIYFPYSSSVILYQYRLNDGNWNNSDQPVINLLNLPYGNYKLELRVKIKGADSLLNEEININIHNPPPFYRQIWFYILVFIILLALVTSLISYGRKQKIKQLTQQFDIAQNRMKMLVMQMKPHFLSNVFNSLQTSFLQDDSLKSSQILKDLDNYLRLSLSSSTMDLVPILSEIEITERYLLLEQNRINKKIELIISKSITDYMEQVKVPVFILQPLVENAIWHGILKSEQEVGTILIDCYEQGDYFVITVEDNGIGIGNSKHKGNSVALTNINERLSLIDNKKKEKYLFIEGMQDGTKVSLYVAKNNKNRSH